MFLSIQCVNYSALHYNLLINITHKWLSLDTLSTQTSKIQHLDIRLQVYIIYSYGRMLVSTIKINNILGFTKRA